MISAAAYARFLGPLPSPNFSQKFDSPRLTLVLAVVSLGRIPTGPFWRRFPPTSTGEIPMNKTFSRLLSVAVMLLLVSLFCTRHMHRRQ